MWDDRWKAQGIPFEPFPITTSDGLKLHGYFFPTTHPHPYGRLVILHGHTDGADHVIWHAQQATQAGFHAVVYDARAHGRSEGNICSFGFKETTDAQRVAEKVLEKDLPGKQAVFLWGISMGGSVGAQALAGATPFSGGVLACPFSSFEAMVDISLMRNGLRRIPFVKRSVLYEIRRCVGFDVREIRPAEAAREIHRPVLVIHGSEDVDIPVQQGHALFNAIPDPRKKFLEVPGAEHADLFATETTWGAGTLRKVFDFLRECAERE